MLLYVLAAAIAARKRHAHTLPTASHVHPYAALEPAQTVLYMQCMHPAEVQLMRCCCSSSAAVLLHAECAAPGLRLHVVVLLLAMLAVSTVEFVTVLQPRSADSSKQYSAQGPSDGVGETNSDGWTPQSATLE